jgi:tRNA-Thr(GGU) m(6)t(6)A37 methyltransferase TsaA
MKMPKLEPIGYVQGGSVVLKEEFTEALLGLEEYSHLYLIFWLHKVTSQGRRTIKVSYASKGGGEGEPITQIGVFATRLPYRKNPLGLTLVKLVEVRGNRLKVEGLDVWDGTPVLDIKPYTGYLKDRPVEAEIRIAPWANSPVESLG